MIKLSSFQNLHILGIFESASYQIFPCKELVLSSSCCVKHEGLVLSYAFIQTNKNVWHSWFRMHFHLTVLIDWLWLASILSIKTIQLQMRMCTVDLDGIYMSMNKWMLTCFSLTGHSWMLRALVTALACSSSNFSFSASGRTVWDGQFLDGQQRVFKQTCLQRNT